MLSVVNMSLCMRVCIWSRAMSRARDILMTWTPVVCFTGSTALIRWEPLCSTARLINEAQPCAAADTCTHTHSGQTDCVGRLRAVYVHTKIYTYILLTVCCPHTLIHICTHTFFGESPSWIQSAPGLHLVALTSEACPITFTNTVAPQMCECVFVYAC